MPNFCSNCGQKLNNNSNFCSGCGFKVDDSKNNYAKEQNAPKNNYVMEQRSAIDTSKSTGSQVLALFAVVLVVGSLIFAVVVTPMFPTSCRVNMYGSNSDYYNSVELTVFEDDQERCVLVLPPRYGGGTGFDVNLGFGEENKEITVTIKNNTTGETLVKQLFIERGENYYISLAPMGL
jgi:Predicted membrane protein